MKATGRNWGRTRPSDINLAAEARDVGLAVTEGGVVEHRVDVVELKFGVAVQIPVQAGGEFGVLAAVAVGAIEVDGGPAGGEFPGTGAFAREDIQHWWTISCGCSMLN